jgi:hypothetical protein
MTNIYAHSETGKKSIPIKILYVSFNLLYNTKSVTLCYLHVSAMRYLIIKIQCIYSKIKSFNCENIRNYFSIGTNNWKEILHIQ